MSWGSIAKTEHEKQTCGFLAGWGHVAVAASIEHGAEREVSYEERIEEPFQEALVEAACGALVAPLDGSVDGDGEMAIILAPASATGLTQCESDALASLRCDKRTDKTRCSRFIVGTMNAVSDKGGTPCRIG